MSGFAIGAAGIATGTFLGAAANIVGYAAVATSLSKLGQRTNKDAPLNFSNLECGGVIIGGAAIFGVFGGESPFFMGMRIATIATTIFATSFVLALRGPLQNYPSLDLRASHPRTLGEVCTQIGEKVAKDMQLSTYIGVGWGITGVMTALSTGSLVYRIFSSTLFAEMSSFFLGNGAVLFFNHLYYSYLEKKDKE